MNLLSTQAFQTKPTSEFSKEPQTYFQLWRPESLNRRLGFAPFKNVQLVLVCLFRNHKPKHFIYDYCFLMHWMIKKSACTWISSIQKSAWLQPTSQERVTCPSSFISGPVKTAGVDLLVLQALILLYRYVCRFLSNCSVSKKLQILLITTLNPTLAGSHSQCWRRQVRPNQLLLAK